MRREDIRKFQRQELTLTFANGRPLTAPLAHWVGALLTTLDQATMNKIVEKIECYKYDAPLRSARLTLPPGFDEVMHG